MVLIRVAWHVVLNMKNEFLILLRGKEVIENINEFLKIFRKRDKKKPFLSRSLSFNR